MPNLQTREQAEDLVRHTYFASKGLRSETSLRTVFNLEGDRAQLLADVNANTILVPQLESATALENLDEILTVDSIDYFNGGVGDLAQSMGLPGEASHPRVQEAWSAAREKVQAAGKRLFEDMIESIRVVDLVYDGAAELLEKHGRKPSMRRMRS